MAQDPLMPLDNGRVGMPSVNTAMNKIAPSDVQGGKGSKEDGLPLGQDRNQADDEKILARMRKRFDRCVQTESENRKAALDDLKFLNGSQWPSDVSAQRQADKRPMLTVNKLKTLAHQVTNDQRQNRPQINVSPVGEHTDREAAKLYRGWIRAVERDSNAAIAYDTGYEGAVHKGIGYWRVISEYEGDDSFDQCLRIKRIRNSFTVYLDPDRQEPDGADAMYGFVAEMMPRHEFEEQYPDADPMPWTAAGWGDQFKAFGDKESIRVVEYYEITHKMRDLVELDNGHVGWEDELDDMVKERIKQRRVKVTRRRKAESRIQTWYKATAKQILESQEWPGRFVPIVQVIGDEIDIEGKVTYSGLIRDAKDPQRMYNYWSSAETEMIALAPKAPFIMEEGQVEGHEDTWKSANTKNAPYLLYRGVNLAGKPAPPPQRQPFAGVPQGIVQAKQGAAQDLMATTGVRFDATMNERLHDESGRAIREVRRSSDIGSFHYVDNLNISLRHTANILIDLAPHYMVTERYVTILNEDDGEETIKIDPHAEKAYQEVKGQDGKTLKVFNPRAGKYSVTATIGPSFATKRIEAAESMMGFAKAMPNVASLIADLIAKHQDWPGADEMARRLAKAVPPQYLTPEQKDVPPQVQAMLTSLDSQVKQLTAERQSLIAQLNDKNEDRALAQDKVNKDFEAKLLGILQKSEDAMQSHAGKLVDQIMTQVERQISSREATMKQGQEPQGMKDD